MALITLIDKSTEALDLAELVISIFIFSISRKLSTLWIMAFLLRTGIILCTRYCSEMVR